MKPNNQTTKGNETMNTTQEKKEQRNTKVKRYFGWGFWIILVVIIEIVIWWYLTPMPAFPLVRLTKDSVTVRAGKPSKADVERTRKNNARALEEEKLKIEEEKYKRDIQRRTVLLQSNIEDAYERFVRQIPFVDAQASMDSARAGAKFLASRDGLCGKTMFNMAYKLTCDKIKGTNTFERFVNPMFEQHVMTHIFSAVDVYKTKMAAFQKELECEVLAYQADVALRGKEFRGFMSGLTLISPEALKKAGERTEAFDSQVKSIATSTVSATIGTAFEVAFIKSTIAAVKSVGKRVIAPFFAKIVARLLASYGVGGGLALADGPLPVGDIFGAVIVLGGSAWTAYEIYRLMDIVPAEIEGNLVCCINEIDFELGKQTSAQAKALVTEMKTWSEEQMKGL